MVSSLRKTKDGVAYSRPKEIEARLEQLESLPESEQVRQCEIASVESSEFVPPECVVYMVRSRRDHHPDDETFRALYEILLRRVLAQLPREEQESYPKQIATKVAIREQVVNQFATLMAKDRNAYFDRLDLFEARFAYSIASLRKTARAKAFKHANRQSPLAVVQESGEMSKSEEKQLETCDSINFDDLEDKDYRTRYLEAIVHLPDDLRIVIELFRQGVPFESDDPTIVSISEVVGKTPKTARKYRDEAIAILQSMLSEEDK